MASFADWFFCESVMKNEAQRTTFVKLICEKRVYSLTLEAVLSGCKPGKPIQREEPTLEHIIRLLAFDFVE
jgi:hypothetical protein